ncbi:MAG TPA: HlyD family type I secretion periplasmic adaptor subunit [Rhodocyclaceae bacterium]|nr:HlyD family type I secretion periplasmic adaptor subunit [Rhodocyclaceae bacterium]
MTTAAKIAALFASALETYERLLVRMDEHLARWLPDSPFDTKGERRLMAFLVLLAAVAFIWAAFAPIDRIVRASGRFIVSGRAQVVQHLEGGIVSEILAREGQHVEAGQVLLKLSKVQANTNLQQDQTRLQALMATQTRLKAEAQGDTHLQFASDIPDEYRLLEEKAFAERGTRLAAELTALRQQIAQKQAELGEATNRSQSLAVELDVAKRQDAMIDGLWRKGAASQMELLDAQGRSQRLNTQYRDTANSIPRLRLAISESEARLNEATARFRSEARAELNQTTAEIAKFNAAVGESSDRLSRTEVRAPTAGYINRLYFNTVGGVIKASEPVLEITPSEGGLMVEARVQPDDRATLRAGLPARITVGAYDYTVYGALDGQVVEVSADTVPDENGHRYYRVIVETRPVKGALAKEVILPGMTANADVVVGQRTVLSYLISPLTRFASKAFREAR